MRAASPGVRPDMQPHGDSHFLPDRPRPGAGAAGFSLVEVVVVILIIGLIALAALRNLPDPRSLEGGLAADQMRAHLRYAQRMAMDRERNVQVIFRVASNSYDVLLADTNVAPVTYALARHPTTQQDWRVNLDDEFQDVTMTAASIGGSNVLVFSSTGGLPCQASGAAVTSTATITFGAKFTVSIIPGTGYVAIQ